MNTNEVRTPQLDRVTAICCLSQVDREIRIKLYDLAGEHGISLGGLADSIRRSIIGFEPMPEAPACPRCPICRLFGVIGRLAGVIGRWLYR